MYIDRYALKMHDNTHIVLGNCIWFIGAIYKIRCHNGTFVHIQINDNCTMAVTVRAYRHA